MRRGLGIPPPPPKKACKRHYSSLLLAVILFLFVIYWASQSLYLDDAVRAFAVLVRPSNLKLYAPPINIVIYTCVVSDYVID